MTYPIISEFALPTGAEAVLLLSRLRVPAAAVDEIVAATPDPEREPARWRMVEAVWRELVAAPDDAIAPAIPTTPAGDDVFARYRCFHAFVAAVSRVRALHRARRVPDDVSWATLADLGGSVERHHREHGRFGFDNEAWVWRHVRARLFRLGRLQFERGFSIADSRPDGPAKGEPVLDIHIPRGGPLTPDACDEAITAAVRFFARHYPDEDYRFAVCTSWLLDPQLAEHLPPASNIMRFQRRFRLAPDRFLGDQDVMRFVFDRPGGSLDGLPQRTHLERVVADRLVSGGHWYVGHGWFRLDWRLTGSD